MHFQSPDADAWRRVSANLIERSCGHYTVDGFPIPGSVTGYRFTAWYRSARSERDSPGRVVLHLGCFDTSTEAKAACEAHRVEHEQKESAAWPSK